VRSQRDCQRRLKVLLVDVEIGHLLPLTEVLRRSGLAATIATSDDEALFEVRVSPPDVVVLDAEIADRGLMNQLRSMISTLPVVLMSSAARHDALWGAMLASVGVTYIDKPVDVQKLLDLLQTQAALSRAVDETVSVPAWARTISLAM